MKIAIVNTWAISKKAVGGTERFVMDLAKSFADNGNEVDVYMFSGNTHIEDGVNYININLFNMIGEADEYFNDLGLAYNTDYKDVSKEISDGKIQEKKTTKEGTLEDNLFDLIESMYDKED